MGKCCVHRGPNRCERDAKVTLVNRSGGKFKFCKRCAMLAKQASVTAIGQYVPPWRSEKDASTHTGGK